MQSRARSFRPLAAGTNDQVHRARGPMGLTFEQPKSVNEGVDVEKPKDERAPVQRLVMRRFAVVGFPIRIYRRSMFRRADRPKIYPPISRGHQSRSVQRVQMIAVL